jgi:hypothetical protein
MEPPVELWADEAGDMRAQALWLPDEQIEVVVSQGERALREQFTPFHRPIFGLDVQDLARVHEIAEALAQRLERGEGESAGG